MIPGDPRDRRHLPPLQRKDHPMNTQPAPVAKWLWVSAGFGIAADPAGVIVDGAELASELGLIGLTVAEARTIVADKFGADTVIVPVGSPRGVLSVSTSLRTGLQTVRGDQHQPVQPPCCSSTDARVTRTLPGSLDDIAAALSIGRPTIGDPTHPFRCTSCDTGYVVRPLAAGGRELVAVTA